VRYSHIPRQVAAGGAALVVGLAALMSVQFYFGQWAASPRYGGLNTQASTDLGYYLRGLGPDTVAYFLGGRFWCHSFLTIAFIAPNARCVNVEVEQLASLSPVTTGGPVVLVALPEREPDLQTIGARVPGLQPVEIPSTSPVRLLEARAVPDSAVAADTALLRAAVVRGMAAYFGAVGASVPIVELERGGWTQQGAMTGATGGIARAAQEAVRAMGASVRQLAMGRS